MAQDLLTFGFYPAISFFAIFALYTIAAELQKLNNKKQ